MRTIVNKLLYRLGYVRKDSFERTLYELAKESNRRNGKTMTYEGEYVRVEIKCVNIH